MPTIAAVDIPGLSVDFAAAELVSLGAVVAEGAARVWNSVTTTVWPAASTDQVVEGLDVSAVCSDASERTSSVTIEVHNHSRRTALCSS